MRALVFANGRLDDPETARALVEPEDLIIAADGGALHCLRLGITPQILVGDFDSLSAEQVQAFQDAGSEVIRHPERKDYTDLELALRLALERGAQEVLVLGALGDRWDQTLANLLLPAANGLQQQAIRLVDGPQEMTLLCGPGSQRVHGQPGDTVSLIPLSGSAQGVSTQGLEYPLVGEKLHFGSTRGISNVLLGETAQVALEDGLLVIVVIHGGKEWR